MYIPLDDEDVDDNILGEQSIEKHIVGIFESHTKTDIANETMIIMKMMKVKFFMYKRKIKVY